MGNQLLATITFVDDDKNELDTFSDADISTLAVKTSGGRGQLGPDTAWFDNFLVVDGISGDYNADGTVNLADFTVWRDALGTSGLAPAADGTGDGQVTAADYNVWKANFGRSNAVAGPLVALAQIPEPSALVLAAAFSGVALAFCGQAGRRS